MKFKISFSEFQEIFPSPKSDIFKPIAFSSDFYAQMHEKVGEVWYVYVTNLTFLDRQFYLPIIYYEMLRKLFHFHVRE